MDEMLSTWIEKHKKVVVLVGSALHLDERPAMKSTLTPTAQPGHAGPMWSQVEIALEECG